MEPHLLKLLWLTPVLVACASQEPARRDSIPRQLAEDLAGGQIYVDLPEGFPDLDLPENVMTDGSLDRGFSMTVMLKSESPADSMQAGIQTALLQSGWIALPTPPMQPRGGFVGNTTPFPGRSSTTQFCHDRYGVMSISPRNRQGVYNRLGLDWNYSTTMSDMSCAQQNELRQSSAVNFNPMAGMNEHMPVLELPEEDQGARFRSPFGGGISGSGDAYTTRSPLRLDWSMAQINRWFARQLEDQGWQHDASWEGDSTAGSTWNKLTDDDTELAGLLDIIHVEDDHYHLRFRLSYK